MRIGSEIVTSDQVDITDLELIARLNGDVIEVEGVATFLGAVG